MASQPLNRLTPHEYLAVERAAEFKSEYIGGEMFARHGASRTHNRISLNVASALIRELASTSCEPFMSDMRVNVGAAFFYPDVVVACEEMRWLDGVFDTLLNPNVLCEVLSASTEAYDRGEKFARYGELESLQDYILISQDRLRVEHFARQAEGKWLLSVYTDPESIVELAGIGCRLSLADVYRKVSFKAD